MNTKKTMTTLSRKRESQVEAGLFDGRFMTRIVKDKKKQSSKMSCRKFSKTDLFKV